MYDLHLTAEQLEFRDTVREFAEREIKPRALHPDRLQAFEKPLLVDLLEKASRMGLRTLALPEEAGGAGADALTSCIVLEELAAGDVDIAAVMAHTALCARALFGNGAPTRAARGALEPFVEDDHCHLAWIGPHRPGAGWCYHRPLVSDDAPEVVAVRQGSEWILNGTVPFAANAPIAKLFIVQATLDAKASGGKGTATVLVPRETAGLAVRNAIGAIGGVVSGGEPAIRWHHGSAAQVVFTKCRLPLERALGEDLSDPGIEPAWSEPQIAAINLGLGRAAYETAVDYAKLRRQGGRNIIEHQAIGSKLADCALRLEIARTMIWKAAWAADHPDAVADRSLSALPLHTLARVYTAEAVHQVTLHAAECFGAMGVMRDMPLQKYVHDALVFLHSEDTDEAAKLGIAEAVAGYERMLAA